MEITIKFDTPKFNARFLRMCGLDNLCLDDPNSNSTRALKILSLFTGVKKGTRHYFNGHFVFTPYYLGEAMKRYLKRLNYTYEWEIQLLAAMILHTCDIVTDLKVEPQAKRLLSLTGDANPKGYYDISYVSNTHTYQLELKSLCKGDFIEEETSDILEWKVKTNTSHCQKLFAYNPSAIETIKDVLEWTSIQGASYPSDTEKIEYVAMLFVKKKDILLKSRHQAVFDPTKDPETQCLRKNDFTKQQLKLLKKSKSC